MSYDPANYNLSSYNVKSYTLDNSKMEQIQVLPQVDLASGSNSYNMNSRSNPNMLVKIESDLQRRVSYFKELEYQGKKGYWETLAQQDVTDMWLWDMVLTVNTWQNSLIFVEGDPGTGKSLAAQTVAEILSIITGKPFSIKENLRSDMTDMIALMSQANDLESYVLDEVLELHGAGSVITVDALQNILKTIRIRQVNLVMVGVEPFQCYDEETELLTLDGWKHHWEVSMEDSFATLDPSTNSMEYRKPVAINVRHYTGKMYQRSGKSIDMCVTPNHRVWSAPLGNPNTLFRFQRADEIVGKRICYKTSARWGGSRLETFIIPEYEYPIHAGHNLMIGKAVAVQVPMNEWVDFLGFWIAEGWATKYSVGIANTDMRLVEKYGNLLSKWGFRPSITTVDRKEQGHLPIHRLEVSSIQLANVLRSLGDAKSKSVPSYVKQLPPDQLSIFFRGYYAGDGLHQGGLKKHYPVSTVTASKHLADDLQEIALKMGLSAVSHRRAPYGKEIKSSEQWVLTYWQGGPDAFRVSDVQYKDTATEEGWVDYDGMVWCPQVEPFNLVYARRNGRPMWNGNSKLYKYVLLTKARYVKSDDWRKTELVGLELWAKVYDDLYGNYIPIGRVWIPTPEEESIAEYIVQEKMPKVLSVQSSSGLPEVDKLAAMRKKAGYK